MKKLHLGHVLVCLCVLAIGSVVGMATKEAFASRNAAGTMSGINGPYVSGTTISSSVVNARLADIETEITDSLDRSGKGGMLAALRGTDGTNAAPAFSFTSETGTGLYRVGTNDLGLAVGGAKLMDWTTSENVTIAGTASSAAVNVLEPSLADGNNVTINLGKSSGGGLEGILTYTKNATPANSTFCLGVFGGSASTLCVDGNDKVLSHSLTIGANGGAIGASKTVTVSLTPGAITGPGCNSGAVQGTSVAVTNIAFGDTCMMAPPSTFSDGRIWTTCSVNSAGNVTVDICSMINITPPTGTYTIRTFQATN